MSSYAELYQQQGVARPGLLAGDGETRPGYTDLYLQQQAEATSRRFASAQRYWEAPHGAAEDNEPHASAGVLVAGYDSGPTPTARGSYAAIAAAAVTAAMSPSGPAGVGSPRLASRGEATAVAAESPRKRLDPSVSRPATTILAQATAMRAARLKRLAQRQQQLQQPAAASTSAAVTAVGGRRIGKQQPVHLSAVLQTAPQMYDRQRLSAVERFIEHVDLLPARYQDAQVVYLSKNSLTSVSGLEQFRELRVLGLADNLVADPDQLDRLAAACPRLEALSLEGNPLAFVPHYRSRVLLALPQLKSLDGRPATEEERAAAPAAVAAEEAVMAVLLRNACVVHKMASVVQRAQVHLELLHAMHSGRGGVLRRVDALGGAAAGAGGSSLARLVEMWDYEGGLGQEERRKIRGALQREVGRMFRQLRAQQPATASTRLGPSWEEAFAQVMTAQQQTTAALLDLLAQCQAATDEMVRSMAAGAGEGAGRSDGEGVGRGGGGGARGGGSGGRALLVRDAEAEAERYRALRREREELLEEFRDAAVRMSRSSPQPRLPLKPALKRTAGREGQQQRDEGGGGARAGGETSPSPPRWHSARAAPPSREAAERLLRARQDAPRPRSSSSASLEDAGPAALAPMQQQPQQQPRGTAGPGAAGRAGGGRAMSADRVRHGDRAGARASGGQAPMAAWSAGAGSQDAAGGAAARRQRSRSVDGSILRRGGGGGGGGAAGGAAGAGVAQSGRPGPASPTKGSRSPPLQLPVWRPGGAAAAAVRSAPASPDYKDAARQVSRVARAQLARTQAEAGTSPDLARQRVAAAAAAEGGLGSPSYAAASPVLLGRRAGSAGARAGRPGAYEPAGARGALPPGRRSLGGGQVGTPTLSEPGLWSSLPHAATAAAVPLPYTLRPYSPTASAGQGGGGGGGGAVAAGVALARIDHLRRQVEESEHETARLRRVAEIASLPLPQRSPPAAAEPLWPPHLQPPPYSTHGPLHAAPQPLYGGVPGFAGGPSAAPLHAPATHSWPSLAWQQHQPQVAMMMQGGATSPSQLRGYPNAPPSPPTLRPPAWGVPSPYNVQPGPAASPQPQPQAPPPSLQPHRGSWPGHALSGTPALHPGARHAALTAPQAPPGPEQPAPAAPLHSAGLGGLGGQGPRYPPAEAGARISHDAPATGPDRGRDAPAGWGPPSYLQPQLQQPPEGTTWAGMLMGVHPEASFASQAAAAQPPPPQLRLRPPPGAADPQATAPPARTLHGGGGSQDASWPLQADAGAHPAAHPWPAGPLAPPPHPGRASWPGPSPAHPSGMPYTTPHLSDLPYTTPPPSSPPDQVTLNEFSVMRASIDGHAPTSTHPSVAGTPSHAAGRFEAAAAAMGGGQEGGQAGWGAGGAGGLLGAWAGAEGAAALARQQQRQQQQGLGSQDAAEAWAGVPQGAPHGRGEPARPHTAASGFMATPAFTLLGPNPGNAAAAATPGGTLLTVLGPRGAAAAAAVTTPGGTVVSVVDDATRGGRGAARVEVQEVEQEDSAGFRDQHIHLHIHPPPVQAPDSANTAASTPQLFLGADRPRPTIAPPPPPHFATPAATPAPDGGATATGAATSSSDFGGALGMLHPGSPLHQGLASGKLVYEKIERIKPAGHSPASPRGVATEGRRGREGASGRRSSRGRNREARGDGLEGVGDGVGGTGRDMHMGFGYGSAGESGQESVGEEVGFEGSDGPGGGGSGRGGSGSGWHGSRRAGDEEGEEEEEGDDEDDGDDVGGGASPGAGARAERRRLGGRPRSTDQGVRWQQPHPHPQQPRQQHAQHHPQQQRGPSSPGGRRQGPTPEVPPALEQQLMAMQQQLTEQAAVGADLAAQLRRLQDRSTIPAAQQDDLGGWAGARPDFGSSAAAAPNAAHSRRNLMPAEGASDEATSTQSSDDGAGAGGGRAFARTASQRERTQMPSARQPPAPAADALPSFQVAPAPARAPPVPAQSSPLGVPPRHATVTVLPSTRLSGEPADGGPSSHASQPASAAQGGRAQVQPAGHDAAAASPPSRRGAAAAAQHELQRPPQHGQPSTAQHRHDQQHQQQHGQHGQQPRPQQQLPEAGPQPQLPPHLLTLAEQMEAHAQRNSELQGQIHALNEQLARDGAEQERAQPPGLVAALAALAASSAPLPAGSVRALEQQLAALTLDKEAVERALLNEQAEMRLLQQELGHRADALEVSQAQLQETRLAVAHQQQELAEQGPQLATATQRLETVGQELEAVGQELEAIKQELTETREQAARVAADTAASHAHELSATRAAANAELLATHAAAHAELQAARDAAHTELHATRAAAEAELHATRAAAEAELHTTRAAAEAELHATRAAAEEELHATRATAEAKLQETRAAADAQLQAAHVAADAQLQAASLELHAARRAAEEELQAARSGAAAELQGARSDAEAELQAFRAAAAAELAEACSAAAAELQQRTDAHAAAIVERDAAEAALRAAHAAQLGAAAEAYAVTLAAQAEQHGVQVARVAERHAAEVAGLHAARTHETEALRQQHHTRLRELAEEQQERLDEHVRREDGAAAAHREQLERLADGAARELEGLRRGAAEALAAAHGEAERAAAVARETHEQAVEELAGRLRAGAEAAEAARVEAEAERTELRGRLDEVLLLLGNERRDHAELRERHAALQAAEADAVRRCGEMVARVEAERRREVAADLLARRSLLRRALGYWAANAALAALASRQGVVAAAAHRRRACRRALRRWHVAVLRTRVARSMARAARVRLATRAVAALKAHMLQRRRKARATAIAAAHHALRRKARCLHAWRRLCRGHARAAAHIDPDAVRSAAAHHGRAVLRGALASWHAFVHVHRLPKTRQSRRAARWHQRRLQRRALAGLALRVAQRSHKRDQLARSVRRHRCDVLNRAIKGWVRRVDAARHKRALLAAAAMQFGHSVVQRWRRAAARRASQRRALATLQASSGVRRMRACLARWRAFLLRRRQAALAARLASEHHRGSLLWRCVSAWLRLAQQAAARQVHVKGMREYQRMMQAALRWQHLVALGRRQQAVVDRAVRLYRHRVVGATQRAVLRGWRAVVEARRAVLRSAAVAFTHAFLNMRLRRVLIAWHREACSEALERGRAASLEVRGQLERSEGALRQAYARLEAVGAQGEELLRQLKEAQSEVLELRHQLDERERRLADTGEALAAAQHGLEAMGADITARADDVAALTAEHAALTQQVKTLRQQVQAGDVSVASLQEQLGGLQRTLAAAQAGARELGLQKQQQAAHYEEALLAARDDAAMARREAETRAAAASRLEQQLADGEAQLLAVRAGHEALLASLRQELRLRDAHIMAAGQGPPPHALGGSGAASAAAMRPPSPAPYGNAPPRPKGPVPWRADRGVSWRPDVARQEADEREDADDEVERSSPASTTSWERRPLFEARLRAPEAAADRRPASAGPQRPGGNGSHLLRTSLRTQPLLLGRSGPPPARAAVQRPHTPPAPDIWTRSPPQPTRLPSGYAPNPAAALPPPPATAAVKEDRGSGPDGQPAVPVVADEPAGSHSGWSFHPGGSARARTRPSEGGGGGDATADSAAAARRQQQQLMHDGAAAARQQQQQLAQAAAAAEAHSAERRASEEAFERTRSRILGSEPAAPARPGGATARLWSPPAAGAAAGGSQVDAAGADRVRQPFPMVSTTEPTPNDGMDRAGEQRVAQPAPAAEAGQQHAGAAAAPRAGELQAPAAAARQAAGAPGQLQAGGGPEVRAAAGGSAAESGRPGPAPGGAPLAPAPHAPPPPPSLTASIVDSLTSLREALRTGHRPAATGAKAWLEGTGTGTGPGAAAAGSLSGGSSGSRGEEFTLRGWQGGAAAQALPGSTPRLQRQHSGGGAAPTWAPAAGAAAPVAAAASPAPRGWGGGAYVSAYGGAVGLLADAEGAFPEAGHVLFTRVGARAASLSVERQGPGLALPGTAGAGGGGGGVQGAAGLGQGPEGEAEGAGLSQPSLGGSAWSLLLLPPTGDTGSSTDGTDGW